MRRKRTSGGGNVATFLRRYRAVIGRALEGVKVTVRPGPADAFPSARDHARTLYDPAHPRAPLVIELAPRMYRTSRQRVDGVLMHEVGHAWWIVRGKLDHTERDADRAGRTVFGTGIQYDRGDVQSTGPGKSPRPRRLPQ